MAIIGDFTYLLLILRYKFIFPPLNLRYEEKLINIVMGFIDQKRTLLEDINNNTHQEQIIILDPFVSKRHTKRLKSSSENHNWQFVSYFLKIK